MNPLEKNRLYDKYLAGDISTDEMHRLNQYALDDDFLFDAIEGAASFENGNAAAIKDLEFRLPSKKRKVRPLYFWLSAAAGVAIIVFALTFIQAPEQEMMSDVVLQQDDMKLEEVSSNGEISTVLPSEDVEYSGEMEPVKAKAGKDKSLANEASNESQTTSIKKDGILDEEFKGADQQNSPAAVTPLPKPAPQISKTLEGIELAQTVEIPPVITEQKEKTIERDDLQLTLTGSSKSSVSEKPASTTLSRDSNKATAFTAVKKPTPEKARKRAQEEAPQVALGDETMLDEEEAITFDDSRTFFEVTILDDPINTLKFQKHTSDAFKSNEHSGEFVATLSIKKGAIDSEIMIVQSINEKLDEQLLKLIETFKGWEGSGNKTVKFLFK